MNSGTIATSEQPSRLRRRNLATPLAMAICALVASGCSVTSRKEYGLEVRSYFADAQGLQAGGPVRLAGVGVGTVKSVQARPELKDHPAEVVLALRTPYVLAVPADATVSLASEGILGRTFVNIDVQNASAAPISQEGVLKSVPSDAPNTEQLLQKMAEILSEKRCGENLNGPPAGKKTKNAPMKAK